MRAITGDEREDAAGTTWEHEFGVDGLMNPDDVCELMAWSRDTLDRRLVDGSLWKGTDPVSGRVKVDRRSVTQYMRRMPMGAQ